MCKSPEQILNYFKDIRLKVLYVNTVFNFLEFSQDPVQYFIDDPIMMQL